MVDNYIGKSETAKRSRAVSRKIAPALKKMNTEGGLAVPRKRGGIV